MPLIIQLEGETETMRRIKRSIPPLASIIKVERIILAGDQKPTPDKIRLAKSTGRGDPYFVPSQLTFLVALDSISGVRLWIGRL